MILRAPLKIIEFDFSRLDESESFLTTRIESLAFFPFNSLLSFFLGEDKEIRNKFIEISFQHKFIPCYRRRSRHGIVIGIFFSSLN